MVVFRVNTHILKEPTEVEEEEGGRWNEMDKDILAGAHGSAELTEGPGEGGFVVPEGTSVKEIYKSQLDVTVASSKSPNITQLAQLVKAPHWGRTQRSS